MGDLLQQSYDFVRTLMILGYTTGTTLIILSTYIATTRGLRQAGLTSKGSLLAFSVAVIIHVLAFS